MIEVPEGSDAQGWGDPEGRVGDSCPLVVDLDGTLLKTDLLFETANALATRHPRWIPRMATWLARGGKAGLKAGLAESVPLDAASLPYNRGLLEWLRGVKARGGILVLATASHRLLAEAVARELDLFDQVLATEEGLNLRSGRKRALLVERFGEGGFDYIGNEGADVPVFQAARHAYLVSSSRSLAARVRALGNLERVFSPERPSPAAAFFKALRIHQWVKNLILFLPLMAAHRFNQAAGLASALLGFLVFGLTASGVYLFNDLVDVADDRNHSHKCNRPFAAGNLSLLWGWALWPLLVVGAFGLAGAVLPRAFLGVLGAYFGLTMLYSLTLKKIAVVDVLTLAGLYTLRIIAGAVATGVPLSFWLLIFSMFLFLSLAFIKRFSELKVARNTGHNGQIRGRGYDPGDLELVSSMGIAAGYMAVLVLAFYIQDPHTAQLYRSPRVIWFACPLLLFWISRTWVVAHRGQMHSDPIVFALKDPMSWVVMGSLAVDLVLARMIP